MVIPVRVHAARFGIRQVPMRLPFRYGAVTLTAAAQVHLFLDVETVSGRRARGVAADMLAPKWFDKDPAKTWADNMDDLLGSAQAAAAAACSSSVPRPVFDIWRDAYDAAHLWGQGQGLNRLTSGYGSTLVERALIDGLGRAARVSYFDLLRENALGLDLGSLHVELAGVAPADLLPPAPRTTMYVRHTIGLLDPLHRQDIAPADRLDDGLPECLDEYILRHGLRYFKIKVGGDVDADVERLTRIAAAMAGVDGCRVSLDGNEQYDDPDQLADLLERLAAGPPPLRRLLDCILYLEQPLDRALSLQAEMAPMIRRLSHLKPMIIDEADDGLETFRLALDRGYRGVSSKACKGMIKALANLGLCRRLSGEDRGALFVTGEDLTCIPLVALHQDLTHLAALDMAHAERNGHHYMRGIDHLPEAERAACRGPHRCLYEDLGPDLTSLRVRNGALDLRCLQTPGLGVAASIDFHTTIPLPAWSPQDLTRLGSIT